MLKLIVNGDDFGASEIIDDAILISFRSGILRSVSLMANGNSFEHAVRIIESNSDLDVGIHFTLVDGEPILKNLNIPSLITEENIFHKNVIQFAKKYFLGKISFDEVRNELRTQIEKLLDYGIHISHIDSHQHVHILPGIFDIVIELAEKFKIKFIRLPREPVSKYMLLDLKSFTRLLQVTTVNYFCAKTRNIFTTDYFAGFYFGGYLNKRNLVKLLNTLPDSGTCELMCHPGFDQTSANGKSQYRRVEEADALVDSEVIDIMKQKNIYPTSFRDLI